MSYEHHESFTLQYFFKFFRWFLVSTTTSFLFVLIAVEKNLPRCIHWLIFFGLRRLSKLKLQSRLLSRVKILRNLKSYIGIKNSDSKNNICCHHLLEAAKLEVFSFVFFSPLKTCTCCWIDSPWLKNLGSIRCVEAP